MPYPESEYVLRDICYFLHLQADYAFIQDDIDWGMFSLPYWEFLEDEPALANSEEQAFIRHGCLLIILAMSLAEAGNICLALGENLDSCRARVDGACTGA